MIFQHRKIAVDENHFDPPKYLHEPFGEPIRIITDVKRGRSGII